MRHQSARRSHDPGKEKWRRTGDCMNQQLAIGT